MTYLRMSVPEGDELCPECRLPLMPNAMWASCECPTAPDEDDEPWTPDDGCYHCGNHQGDERYASGAMLCERCETAPWVPNFPSPPISGCPCAQCQRDTARKGQS